MKWLLPGGRSIRQKLITIVLATTFLALAIAGAILVVFDLKSYQETLESDLATQADIVGRLAVYSEAWFASRTYSTCTRLPSVPVPEHDGRT